MEGTINTKPQSKTYRLVMTALMASVICILAPMSIQIGDIPISLTNLAIYIILYILGWKQGSISYLVYMLIGMVGVPVFSGFTGGLGKLLGYTGGYIIGFLPMAIVAGLVIDHTKNRFFHLLGMVVGTIICYALGTAWYCFSSGTPVGAALAVCVIPFIPFDLLKMVFAIEVGPLIRSRLSSDGVYHKI